MRNERVPYDFITGVPLGLYADFTFYLFIVVGITAHPPEIRGISISTIKKNDLHLLGMPPVQWCRDGIQVFLGLYRHVTTFTICVTSLFIIATLFVAIISPTITFLFILVSRAHDPLACGRNREFWEQPFQTYAIDEDCVKKDGQNSVIFFVISK